MTFQEGVFPRRSARASCRPSKMARHAGLLPSRYHGYRRSDQDMPIRATTGCAKQKHHTHSGLGIFRHGSGSPAPMVAATMPPTARRSNVHADGSTLTTRHDDCAPAAPEARRLITSARQRWPLPRRALLRAESSRRIPAKSLP